jgi:hypothetical protein|tara:strand:- start:318 stop:686 length:369 start_codon:yes stop_codon:yes gene_type:complete
MEETKNEPMKFVRTLKNEKMDDKGSWIYQTLWSYEPDGLNPMHVVVSSSRMRVKQTDERYEVNETMVFKSNSEGDFEGSDDIDVWYPATKSLVDMRKFAETGFGQLLSIATEGKQGAEEPPF